MHIRAGPWENLPYEKIANFKITADICLGQLKNSYLV